MSNDYDLGYGMETTRKPSPLLLMALTVFIDISGFGLILPLLAFWAERVGANAFGVGLALTMYALAQFLFTPLLGSLSDRFGRKPIIVVSLLIEAVAFVLTALSGTLPLLLAARFVGGIGASNIGSAQAVVADVTPPEKRARGMGMIGAAIGLGFVVGPAAGGALAALGPSVPFWAAAGVALVNAALVLALLPETHRAGSALAGARAMEARPSTRRTWQDVLQSPTLVRLLAINLLFTLAFTAMETVFPLFTQRTYGWGAEANGYIFAYVGIVMVIMQGGLVGRLVRRFGEHTLLSAGLVLLAVGLALLALGTHLGVLLLALGVLALGEGAVTPTSSALVSINSPVHAQGSTLGLAQGMASLGRILGPLAAGLLFDRLWTGAPFLAGGVIVALAAVVSLPTLQSLHHLSTPATTETHTRQDASHDASTVGEPHPVH